MNRQPENPPPWTFDGATHTGVSWLHDKNHMVVHNSQQNKLFAIDAVNAYAEWVPCYLALRRCEIGLPEYLMRMDKLLKSIGEENGA